MNLKKILYHYCSIETFKLILKNKTIRFSSLGKVDDLEEALTSDFDDFGRVCFVSCWTDLEQESIEMWRSYTQGLPGVRIGLPEDFFAMERSKWKDQDIINESIEIGNNYDLQLSPPYYPCVTPVTYTEDEELINIPVVDERVETCSKCGKQTASLGLKTKYIGKFKRKYWSGQAEWRYKLIAMPKEYHRNHEKGKYLGDPQEMLELMKTDLKEMTFKTDYIDFPFNKELLEEIDVVASPYNTDDDNKIVEEIMKEYTNVTNFQLEKSKLLMRK